MIRLLFLIILLFLFFIGFVFLRAFGLFRFPPSSSLGSSIFSRWLTKGERGWFGKIAGGALGLGFGGPIGAVIGLIIGNVIDGDIKSGAYGFEPTFDAESYRGASRSRRLKTPFGVAEAQAVFFVSVFSMLAKLAKADGAVSQGEVAVIENFIVNTLQLDAERRAFAINAFRVAKNSPEPFEAFAFQYYQLFAGKTELLELMVDLLLSVAMVDGQMNQVEESMIRQAVYIFHLPDSRYQQLKARYLPKESTTDYYAVLGCKAGDKLELIKKAYRQLVMEYHPDRLANKGVSEEFRKFSEKKFREIQDAYEKVLAERKKS